MPLILNIETATTVCSVALAKDGEIISYKEQNEGYTHAENLTVFIEEVVTKSGFTFRDIDAIAVSKGPGSYTGLRIGVSTAKGLCYALDKPLISINTLLHTTLPVITNLKSNVTLSGSDSYRNEGSQLTTLFCPMIDARRMEVYCAIYNSELNCIKETVAEIIDEHSFSEILKENKVIFFGDGAAKCKEILSKNTNAIFTDTVFPSAKNMVTFSEEAFKNKRFENVAYFEPFYLKDFVAGKKKGE